MGSRHRPETALGPAGDLPCPLHAPACDPTPITQLKVRTRAKSRVSIETQELRLSSLECDFPGINILNCNPKPLVIGTRHQRLCHQIRQCNHLHHCRSAQVHSLHRHLAASAEVAWNQQVGRTALRRCDVRLMSSVFWIKLLMLPT